MDPTQQAQASASSRETRGSEAGRNKLDRCSVACLTAAKCRARSVMPAPMMLARRCFGAGSGQRAGVVFKLQDWRAPIGSLTPHSSSPSKVALQGVRSWLGSSALELDAALCSYPKCHALRPVSFSGAHQLHPGPRPNFREVLATPILARPSGIPPYYGVVRCKS